MKIRLSRILATIIVVLGLTVACIPKFIFPICESSNLGFLTSYQPVMRCFWFGRAEILLGLLVVLAGFIALCRPTPDARFATGVVLIGLGLAVIMVSVNTIIGSTCGHMHSLCQTGTKPAERIIGGLIIILGMILAVSTVKRREQK